MNRARLGDAMTSFAARWNGFWFTPKDPTLLGLMRILAGAVTVYTFIVHGLTLPQYMGQDAWVDLPLRMQQVRLQPYAIGALTGYPLSGNDMPIPAPADDFQKKYYADYLAHWGFPPPCCYPKNKDEADFADRYRDMYQNDFRGAGLTFPRDEDELWYINWYATEFKSAAVPSMPSPPPYPDRATIQAMKQIYSDLANGLLPPANLAQLPGVKEQFDRLAFFKEFGIDPRKMQEQGYDIWSVWFHVTDPFWMNVIQIAFVARSRLHGPRSRHPRRDPDRLVREPVVHPPRPVHPVRRRHDDERAPPLLHDRPERSGPVAR